MNSLPLACEQYVDKNETCQGYITPEVAGKWGGLCAQDLPFSDIPNGLAALKVVPILGRVLLVVGCCCSCIIACCCFLSGCFSGHVFVIEQSVRSESEDALGVFLSFPGTCKAGCRCSCTPGLSKPRPAWARMPGARRNRETWDGSHRSSPRARMRERSSDCLRRLPMDAWQ